jgi:hypothetical protein
VSGGSYIAASRALVARDLTDSASPAYGPGTPEEQRLRDNTHYLAPNGGIVLVGVLSLLVGVLVTALLVLAPVFAVAHAWGWLLRSQKVLCPGSVQQCGAPGPFVASVTSPAWWWLVPTVAAGLTLLLFGCWWVTLKPPQEDRQAEPRQEQSRDRGGTLAKLTGWAAFLTAVLAIAMLVAPLLLSWVAKLPAGPFKSLVYDLGFGVGRKWTPAALTGVFAALIAVAQSCRAKLAQLQLPAAQGKPASQTKAQTQQQNAAQPGFLAGIGAQIRTYLLPWVASAVIVLVAIVAGLRWMKDGAAAGYSAEQLWPVLVALGVVLAMRVFADVNRISMHDFYCWRLASAYAVRRYRSGKSGPEQVAADPGALLSSLAAESPQLVICATANINADRQVPVGRGGMLLTFDPQQVTLRGEDPEHPVAASTMDYEFLVGRQRFTLFDVSAISGAAISPLMGSATRQAYRILLTMANVRLGVWLPHPAIVDAASRELEAQDKFAEHNGRRPRKNDHLWHACGLLLWYAFPWHPRWSDATQEPGGGEARLWAYVLRMRRKDTPGARATAPPGSASPTEGITTTSAWSKRCGGAPRTSWCWTPAGTRPTPGTRWAARSPWPGSTPGSISSSTRRRCARNRCTRGRWPSRGRTARSPGSGTGRAGERRRTGRGSRARGRSGYASSAGGRVRRGTSGRTPASTPSSPGSQLCSSSTTERSSTPTANWA